MQEAVQFNAIQTNDGFYIQISTGNHVYFSSGYLFDGVAAEKTFHKDWGFIKNKPEKVAKIQGKEYINQRYELKDSSIAEKLSIPVVIYIDGKNLFKDSDGNLIFSENLNQYKSLYQYKVDECVPEPLEVEFNFNIITVIDKIINAELELNFKYPVYRTQWSSDGTRVFNANEIKHYLIEEILYPDIVLPSRPCYLSSKQVYDIVRLHVITHINPKVAKITSDYDFCFTVKKMVELHKPESYRVDVSSLKSKKPKWEERFRNYREVEVFEMTHDQVNYNKYTPINSITAANHEELKKILDKLLDGIMQKINQPVKECCNCGGTGVLFD